MTLYMQSGGINMSGGAMVNLTASAGGPYSGILIFQDRNNTSAANLTGGATQIMNGVLYFPNAAMRYTGGSSTTATSSQKSNDNPQQLHQRGRIDAVHWHPEWRVPDRIGRLRHRSSAE